MIQLELSPGDRSGLTVLLLGAHSDDIEIGVGGTLLELLRARSDVSVHWVVLSAAGSREDEARRSAARFLEGARESDVTTHTFRDGYFPHEGARLKDTFEEMKRIDPDIVFTHYGKDRHQDHRMVSELTWNTFRSHLVLEYEIPKYDGGLGSPNVFVPIGPEARNRKIDILMEEFATQRSKRWFTRETFEGLMRIRGIESPDDTGWAEAFYGRKMVLKVSGAL